MKTRRALFAGSTLLAAVLAVPAHVQAGNIILLTAVPVSASPDVFFFGSNVFPASVGDQITFNIYADVEDDAQTPTNCFWEQSELSLTSTSDSLQGIQGTFAATGATSGNPAVAGVVSYNNTLIASADSEPGYETDGYNTSTNPPTANDLVNSVGGTVPTNNNFGPASQGGGQWIYLTTGANGFQPTSQDITIGGISYAQFNLGSFTFVVSQLAAGYSTDTLAVGSRPLTAGTVSMREIEKYISDGTTELLSFGNTNIVYGSNDVMNLPEPASLTLLAMVLAALGIRARGLARLPGPK